MRKILRFLVVFVSALLVWGIAFAFDIPNGLARTAMDYEVWASDQSNSKAGASAPGISGSWIWIWDSRDLNQQVKTGKPAAPIGCDGRNRPGTGPCNLYDVFPASLKEYDTNGLTGNTLADVSGFGRLHGVLSDPQNRYLNASFFAPDGGYVGIIDGETKEAVSLFRVSGTSEGRSVHMSFWNTNGSALLIANLNGKVLERIDIKRDRGGKIINAVFNKSASLGVGKNLQISDQPKVYLGKNSQGRSMIGSITGNYDLQALGNLTPNGLCKENGCGTGSDAPLGGRPMNMIICPVPADNGKVFVSFSGGGLMVADAKTTPMSIVGEYSNQFFNGAGCGGVQVSKNMWLNTGVGTSAAGATQSTYTIYDINTQAFGKTANAPNTPAPRVIFKDPNNTATGGNSSGQASNSTGQLPGVSTRRDAHGIAQTLDGLYVHAADRIQNRIEVFNTKTLAITSYDLTSADGKGNNIGPCASTSVPDYPRSLSNDPAPDLMQATPDNKYLVVALRGPIPVSVNHASQGSCPGIGVIELTQRGASGKLVSVLRASNTVDTVKVDIPAPGGYAYQGNEHSDIHNIAIRQKHHPGGSIFDFHIKP